MVAANKTRELVLDLPCAVCQGPLRDHPDGLSPYADNHDVEMSAEDEDRLSESEVDYWVRYSERLRRGEYSIELPPPEERRMIREAPGWTQEDLADELELTRYVAIQFEKRSGYRIGGERLSGREPGGEVRERRENIESLTLRER